MSKHVDNLVPSATPSRPAATVPTLTPYTSNPTPYTLNHTPYTPHPTPHTLARSARTVDIRLPGNVNSNSHGARPVHQIITPCKCSLSGMGLRRARLPPAQLRRCQPPHPNPQTSNPKPHTLNPKLSTQKLLVDDSSRGKVVRAQ
jgi:hypothetical protein